MDSTKPESDNDSDVILIDNPPETISIAGSSPEIGERRKEKKQPKRKVQIGIDHTNHVETLWVTQKLKVKQTKFKCIIDISNIETVPKKRKRKPKKSNCIKRFNKNPIISNKLPDFYERIVPICLRNNCVHKNKRRAKLNCCRLRKTKAKLEEKSRERIRSVSPISISSLSLTGYAHDITYEDVSGGEFPDFSSEDEVDTLIRRTKEREKQFTEQFSLSGLLYTSSPLRTNEDVASAHSNASTHSKATLVLTPVIGAYSTTASPYIIHDTPSEIEAPLANHEDENDDEDEIVAYSPTASPYIIDDTPSEIEAPLANHEDEKDYLDQYSSTYLNATPARIDCIEDFDQDTTAEDFIAIKEVNGRTNISLIEFENDEYSPDLSNVKVEVLEDINCNTTVDVKEITVKRENGCDFRNITREIPENREEIIVKREIRSHFPDVMNHVKPYI